MRSLASIQTVNAVEPIPGADAIEKVRVLGWWVLTKRGEYRVGDGVIYCEIDSLLPERPEFEFLRGSSYKAAQVDPSTGVAVLPPGFRIRTAKLRGQVSQGICFPRTLLPDGPELPEGSDVSDRLGVVKWEPPLPVGMLGKIRGLFPSFVPKNDETRVQVLGATLERHQGRTFHVTEKLDGTSFTAFVRDGIYGVCSRNLWLDERDDSNLLVRLATSLNLEAHLRAASDRLGVDLAIQAEAIGPGIQKNKYALPQVCLRVFNVLDLSSQRLLDHAPALAEIADLGLQPVPDLGTILLDPTVDALVTRAEGTSTLNPRIQREGIVLRPPTEEHDDTIPGRLSFKAINPKFLLKYDDC